MKECRVVVRGCKALLLSVGLLVIVAQSGFAATPDAYVQTIEVMKKDPATGVVATEQYLSTHPDIPASQRALIVWTLADNYAEKLHNTQSALTALDNGLAVIAKMAPKYPNTEARIDGAQATLLLKKGDVLVASSPEQAVALLDTNIPLLLKANTTSFTYLYGMVMLYQKALPPAKRPEKLVPIIQKSLQLNPRDAQEIWLMERLVGYLQQQNKGDEALSYAKLAWMVCPFDQKSISVCTTLLSTVWLTKDLNAGKGNAFMAAQKDASLPNPLTDIKLPTLDQQTWDATLQSLPAADTTDRVTILLMEGKMREAMLAARQDLLAHPTTENSTAVLEMARVFKANDLNVVRANAFLQYFQTGKGTNPLDEFFNQHPAQPAAAK